MVTVEPYGVLPAGEVPRTAPATTVELYCAADAGHTPTRWTALSAWTASLQLENEVRFGMATGGGPVETTTVDDRALLGGDRAARRARAAGCWLTMIPAAAVMDGWCPMTRTVKWSGAAAVDAVARVFPTSTGTGWLGVKTPPWTAQATPPAMSTGTRTAIATIQRRRCPARDGTPSRVALAALGFLAVAVTAWAGAPSSVRSCSAAATRRVGRTSAGSISPS